jgi:hypothetical protein
MGTFAMKPSAHRISGRVWAAVLCLSSLAGAQDAPVSEAARAHFKMGLDYLNDPAGPRYEDALREFATARTAAPSSWKTLNNIGLCALNLERDQEAIDAYEQALALAGSTADGNWRDTVQRDIATLKAGLVRVAITVRPAGATLLDERLPASGRSVLNRYASLGGTFNLGIHAGHHRISAIFGSKTDAWEFDAVAGATMSHSFHLEPEQPVEPPPSPAPPPAASMSETTNRLGDPSLGRHARASVYVGLVATGALATGALVTGALAVAKHNDFDEKNGHAPVSQTDEIKQSGKQLVMVTDVFIVAAVLAAAGTSYLYFSQPREPRTSTVRVLSSVGPGGGTLAVSGRF